VNQPKEENKESKNIVELPEGGIDNQEPLCRCAADEENWKDRKQEKNALLQKQD
jgi:hypothetical protein